VFEGDAVKIWLREDKPPDSSSSLFISALNKTLIVDSLTLTSI
jgi:hypothetical protein